MAEILVPDVRDPEGAEVAARLRAGGHTVHVCLEGPADAACIELTGGLCPLEGHPVDVAVVAGARSASDTLDDGGLCAVRRRIPVLLVGAPSGHALIPWAASNTTAPQVASEVQEVLDKPLAGHSAAGQKALLHELRGQGDLSENAAVEVFRRPGRLVVELTTGLGVSHAQAELLAAHVVQAVRLYDRWAPKIDVIVRPAPTHGGRTIG